MTALTRVSASEMKKRTGFGKALGYSLPKEDEILIRDDLPKDIEHEVVAHEEEHIAKGEEGPFLGALLGGIGSFLGSSAGAVTLGVGASLLGGKKQSDAAKRATAAQSQAAADEIASATETRDLLRQDQAPYREAGHTALNALMSLTGLGGGSGGGSSAPRAAPTNVDPSVRMNDAGRGVALNQFGNYRNTAYARRYNLRAGGGAIQPDEYYNVHELGPENVYSDGSYTRGKGPATIDGRTGYVEPNIRGRAIGGFMGGAYDDTRSYSPIKQSGFDTRQPRTKNPAINPAASNTTTINPQTGYPRENPGGVEGGYQFQTEPGYQFRFSEGQRALERGAAQRGGLLSGGYARKAIRYGQGFASNEFANVYNRISNIAGLGQTANQQGLYGALNTSQQVGGALSNQGAARASGYTAQGNAWANAGNDIANLPWGNVFNQGGGTKYYPSGVDGLDMIDLGSLPTRK